MRFGIVGNAGDDTNNEKKPQRSAAEPLGPEQYGEIEAALGYEFSEREWLQRALTHRSVHGKGVKIGRAHV